MVWKEVKVSQIYSDLFDGPHATPKPSKDGPIFLSIKNLREDGQLDLTEIKHISESEFPRWTKRVTPKFGDIVFTYEATLNRYAIIPEGFVGCLGRRLALVRPDNKKAHYRFLFYYFLSEAWRKEVGNYILTGTTVDRIPLTKFPVFKLRIPELETQRKIAAILTAYDDLIETNKCRIALLEKMAEEIYREWFVRLRFPGYQNTKFVKGIPEGWSIKRLEDIAKFENGDRGKNYPRSKDFVEDGIAFINAGHLVDGAIDSQNVNNITEGSFSRISSGKIKKGDLVFCVRGSLGRMARVTSTTKGAIASSLVIIRPSENHIRAYLYYLLAGERGQRLVVELDNGVAQPNISVQSLKRCSVLFPPVRVLKEFELLVQPTWEMVSNLREQSGNLTKTRDLLLPRLISGKLPVQHLNIKTPPSMTPN